jgi:uncharacterized protein
MFIDINEIGPEGLALDTALNLPEFHRAWGEVVPVRSISLAARVTKGNRGTEIEGRLNAVVSVRCSRCLEPVEEKLAVELFLVAVTEEPEDPERWENSEEEAWRDALLTVEDGRIDLLQVAAEQIELNLSRKPVCSEDCRGLCPRCGVNRNAAECGCTGEEIDPRLAPLLKF